MRNKESSASKSERAALGMQIDLLAKIENLDGSIVADLRQGVMDNLDKSLKERKLKINAIISMEKHIAPEVDSRSNSDLILEKRKRLAVYNENTQMVYKLISEKIADIKVEMRKTAGNLSRISKFKSNTGDGTGEGVDSQI